MTRQRVERCFQRCREAKRPALVIYLCIGDPSVDDSFECAKAALEAGADILELGVPFSDPTADGPVIAAASYRAIQQGGSLKAALGVAKKLRALDADAPFILFSYYNPIYAFGPAKLPAAAADAGADGLLVVDLPPEEGAELRAAAEAAELAVIPLLTPTSTDERIRAGLKQASGFVYYVSLTGVTGSGAAPLAEAGTRARELSQKGELPVVVGFGVDGPKKAKVLKDENVDGVVVGTAVVKAVVGASDGTSRVQAVKQLVGSLRAAIS